VTELHRLTVYFGERARHHGRFVTDSLLDVGAAEAGATAVVLRGAAGFGPRHDIRTDLTLSQSEDLPIALIAVGPAEPIAALAGRAAGALARGTVTVERVRYAGDAVKAAHVELAVITGRADRLNGRPAHVAVCGTLHRLGFVSATSLLGVDGITAGQRRRAAFFGRNAAVPVLTVAAGSASAAGEAIRLLRPLLPSAVMTVAPIQLCKGRGVPVNRPAPVPPTGDRGLAHWQKVTVHTCEADLHRGLPVHRTLLRRLRESPTTAGVTVLRGVWGFAGDAEPGGDRMFQVGRHVPVTTEYVDTPDRIAACFDLVDDVTDGRGVVTCTTIPAVMSIDSGRRRGGLRPASAPEM
jgi:PII-like signaling protein